MRRNKAKEQKKAISNVSKRERFYNSLTMEQREFVEDYALDFSKADITEFFTAMDRVLRVYFNNNTDMSMTKIEAQLNTIFDKIGEEGIKGREIKSKGKAYSQVIEDLRPKIIEAFLLECNNSIDDETLYNKLADRFPQVSKLSIQSVTIEWIRDNNIQELQKNVKKLENQGDLKVINREVNATVKGNYGIWRLEGDRTYLDDKRIFDTKEDIEAWYKAKIEQINTFKKELDNLHNVI